MGIIVRFDVDENEGYVSRRLAIGITIFILYFIHFIFQALAYFSAEEKVLKHKLDHLSKKLYLFAIATFISFNYLQGGVFEAIMAWFTLVVALTLHITVMPSFAKPNFENKLWVFYYTMLWIYFLGIIISYYSSNDS